MCTHIVYLKKIKLRRSETRDAPWLLHSDVSAFVNIQSFKMFYNLLRNKRKPKAPKWLHSSTANRKRETNGAVNGALWSPMLFILSLWIRLKHKPGFMTYKPGPVRRSTLSSCLNAYLTDFNSALSTSHHSSSMFHLSAKEPQPSQPFFRGC